MTDRLYTIAVLPAAKGKVDLLIEQLETLAEQTRKETGCIEYGFYQNQGDPNAEAEAAHWETSHLTSAIEAFGHTLDGQPTIYKGPRII